MGYMEIDNSDVIDLYENKRFTLRMIADKYQTNHHMIKRILLRNGIEITRRKSLKPFTQVHKDKISATRKKLYASGEIVCWAKGKSMTRECKLKNMRAHLKYDVSFKWLDGFDDVEKLKFLNKSISKERDCSEFTTDTYIQYIERFYVDEKFNKLYAEWMRTQDKWIKPSLDHIIAKTNGGGLSIDNLQFISWLENRAKADITQSKWENMKDNIGYYL